MQRLGEIVKEKEEEEEKKPVSAICPPFASVCTWAWRTWVYDGVSFASSTFLSSAGP